ncbi:GRP family sugar transporter [Paenibacillus sp. J22TS3]|uniref:GRP family sugar transporter n=1 Tax=Paenibacillus sp. J22TS3 TaxID=2807192 RepID=UPI001B0D94DE|nr:GRP family sugar transporter [Paenibacillus sp. J22TS3]GIP23785.1 putative glucose uptake protein GlcU [Paenibacillus sp. J22TS3]
MYLLLALLPAVCWGSIVFFNSKLGGDAYSQVLGTGFGALIFSVLLYVFKSPPMSPLIWTVGIVSGLFWSVGQSNQLRAVQYLGVSRTVPLSTGMQLVATALIGVLVFHEWSSMFTIILGSAAIICIIAGAVFTVVRDKDNPGNDKKAAMGHGTGILLLSTLGYLVYVSLIRWYDINGWSAVLPQGIGITAGTLLLTYRHRPFNKYMVRNIITGLWWGIGNLGLLLSLPHIGQATSFSLSQTGIIISTLGGIFFLGEKKSRRQMVFVIVGCCLIIAGGVMMGFTKR